MQFQKFIKCYIQNNNKEKQIKKIYKKIQTKLKKLYITNIVQVYQGSGLIDIIKNKISLHFLLNFLKCINIKFYT